MAAGGRITEGGGLTAGDENGDPIDVSSPGWKHF